MACKTDEGEVITEVKTTSECLKHLKDIANRFIACGAYPMVHITHISFDAPTTEGFNFFEIKGGKSLKKTTLYAYMYRINP